MKSRPLNSLFPARSFLFLLLLCTAIIPASLARENKAGQKHTLKIQAAKSAATCPTPTAQTDLDVNNVRTTIMTGGDMWWDLANPAYEIPRGSHKHSIYSGALWIGGVDGAGQIKVAAQTYRQTGSDFWAGPMDVVQVNITPDVCNAFDKHFVTTRADIIQYLNDPASVSASVTNVIHTWPGNGNPVYNQGPFLAPFFDQNGNGAYEPDKGDYPYYNLTGNFLQPYPGYNKTECNDFLFGDKNLWWVFNDVGNVHSETFSESIGLEIRAQAFAFNTNDEINNMTFYKYQVINRGSSSLNNTYFGQWVDPDLGFSDDDYVGCDVQRGLGFVYNGDAEDEGVSGYGYNPPSLGIDFFQGPRADANDGIDNDRDGCKDCTYIDSSGISVPVDDDIIPEQIIMSKFVYYNNINDNAMGNPDGYNDFYKYLRGRWLDDVPITYGFDGRNTSRPSCDFMFPGSTDSANFAQFGSWGEVEAGFLAGDRRFLQSAGPFTLLPGAVNYITTGAVWARANQGGPEASIELMKVADDKAQALFDNCFKLLDGPDAPVVEIRELNQELVFSLLNTDTTSVELYDEKDPTITGYPDSLCRFRFQGYKVFQLRDAYVSTSDLDNPDKARMIRQFDIRDGVTQLVNYVFDQNLGGNVPVEMVNGADEGIDHSFSITADAFASGNTVLVNNKTYYYTVVSYAYNQYKKYDPIDPNALDGQKRPYLEGRNNITTYSGIPHLTTPENQGTYLNAHYGDGPEIQRIEGQGNGGLVLDLTTKTEEEILQAPDHRSYHPVYRASRGPLAVKIYDPVRVVNGNYEFRFDGVSADSHWLMSDLAPGGSAIQSLKTIGVDYEQLFPAYGLSAHIMKSSDPGASGAVNNGFLEGDMTFADNSKQWLTGFADNDQSTVSNWIWSGTSTIAPADVIGDPGEVYENVVEGTWAPMRFTASDPFHPKWNGGAQFDVNLKLEKLASIDLVITADKSKWSRSAVVETSDLGLPGQAKKADIRFGPSRDKDGRYNFPAPGNDDFQSGMSWFPGYAINLETGERLNIVFGENSSLSEQNGNDMIWNPTSAITDASLNTVLGGMHFIYVMGHNGDAPSDMPLYDGCAAFHTFLDSALKTGNISLKRNAWKDALWVNIPLVNGNKVTYAPGDTGKAFIPPAEVRIRLRVTKDYRSYVKQIREQETLIEGQSYQVYSGTVTYQGTVFTAGQVFTAVTAGHFSGSGTVTTPASENNFLPLYRINTGNLAASSHQANARRDALALINIVPNPYYAISGYEGTAGLTGQVDTRVRLTNLPAECRISIFTSSGTLIRQFNRSAMPDLSGGGSIKSENTNTSQDWDLKNQRGIIISSGMYLIHVEVPGVGERVIKWFGVIRPADLDTF